MIRNSRSPLFDSSTLSFTFNGVRTVSNISLHTCMLGSTINSMNPICDSATKVLLRSHSGENGNPSAFSLSPWRKNSSNSCIVHLRGRNNNITLDLNFLSCLIIKWESVEFCNYIENINFWNYIKDIMELFKEILIKELKSDGCLNKWKWFLFDCKIGSDF